MKSNNLWDQVLTSYINCALPLPTVLIAAYDYGEAATVREMPVPVNNGRTSQK
jgi:hypothetical protein